ncbi:hypothetical protein [Endozoicomonas sp.]|uniref:hypothetical protein n=1 Tax=Endozoicomonas sp. TaxID=1892382 RepID=UPI0028864857|nr:WD40 repeat domain-containing protein [Endozoicomonas sp.]
MGNGIIPTGSTDSSFQSSANGVLPTLSGDLVRNTKLMGKRVRVETNHETCLVNQALSIEKNLKTELKHQKIEKLPHVSRNTFHQLNLTKLAEKLAEKLGINRIPDLIKQALGATASEDIQVICQTDFHTSTVHVTCQAGSRISIENITDQSGIHHITVQVTSPDSDNLTVHQTCQLAALAMPVTTIHPQADASRVDSSSPEHKKIPEQPAPEKILPTPVFLESLKPSETIGRVTTVKCLSDQRVAIGYSRGQVLIWNINNADNPPPISLKHYDDGIRNEASVGDVQQIKELSGHRLVTVSERRVRVWDMQSSSPHLLKTIHTPLYTKDSNHSSFTKISQNRITFVTDGVIQCLNLEEGSEGERLTETKTKVFPSFLDKENWEQQGNKLDRELITLVKQWFKCSDNGAIEIINNNKNNFAIKTILTLRNGDAATIKTLHINNVTSDLTKHNSMPLIFVCLEIYGLTNDHAELKYHDTIPTRQSSFKMALNMSETDHIAVISDNKIYLWNGSSMSDSPRILRGHTSYAFRLIELANGLFASLSHNEVLIWDLKDPTYPCLAELKERTSGFYDLRQLSNELIVTTSTNGTVNTWDLSDRQPPDNPLSNGTDRFRLNPEKPLPLSPIGSLPPPSGTENLKDFSVWDEALWDCSADGKAYLLKKQDGAVAVYDLFPPPISRSGN